jgi:hypothetical protein
MTALISLNSMPGSAASGKSAPVLSITHGLHQGVCLSLDRSVYILGSAADADLLLSDGGIAERHMALRFANGQVAVEAIGGDVFVFGAHAREMLIPAGKGHRARLPLDIRIGEARLTLTREDDPLRAPASASGVPAWLRKPQWVIALLLMFLCVGAFAFRGEPAPLAPGSAAFPAPFSVRSSGEAGQPGQPTATAADARLWLEQQLASAELAHVKVVEVDGQLSVKGFYDPAQKAQWRSVQHAFDSRFGQQVMLHPDVVPRAEIARPRVRFQAVWFGTNPYVINDSGKRLYPGAPLADDWTLHSIENNQVILARGEERFTFTL